MTSFVQHVVSIDQDSFLLMLAMCACAALILKTQLDRPFFVLATGLLFLPTALAFRTLMIDFNMLPTSDWFSNLAIATGAGLIAAFAATSGAFLLFESVRSA